MRNSRPCKSSGMYEHYKMCDFSVTIKPLHINRTLINIELPYFHQPQLQLKDSYIHINRFNKADGHSA